MRFSIGPMKAMRHVRTATGTPVRPSAYILRSVSQRASISVIVVRFAPMLGRIDPTRPLPQAVLTHVVVISCVSLRTEVQQE